MKKAKNTDGFKFHWLNPKIEPRPTPPAGMAYSPRANSRRVIA